MSFFNSKPMLLTLTAAISFSVAPLYSEPLSQAIKIESSTNSAAIKSQKKIDGLSDETRRMLDQYRTSIHQIESLKVYNKHLQELLKSQQEEQQSLERQLQEIETTQREIVPLTLNMLDSLEKFIQLDMPFLAKERLERLVNLKAMMVRADVSNAEKYRRILEAYQIENDYGNSIESYQADLELDGVVSSVDVLRLGRVALYYQRLDGSETGYWNKENKQWQILSPDYRNAIRQGLRIARKEAAPDLLTLPVPAVEAGQ